MMRHTDNWPRLRKAIEDAHADALVAVANAWVTDAQANALGKNINDTGKLVASIGIINAPKNTTRQAFVPLTAPDEAIPLVDMKEGDIGLTMGCFTDYAFPVEFGWGSLGEQGADSSRDAHYMVGPDKVSTAQPRWWYHHTKKRWVVTSYKARPFARPAFETAIEDDGPILFLKSLQAYVKQAVPDITKEPKP